MTQIKDEKLKKFDLYQKQEDNFRVIASMAAAGAIVVTALIVILIWLMFSLGTAMSSIADDWTADGAATVLERVGK